MRADPQPAGQNVDQEQADGLAAPLLIAVSAIRLPVVDEQGETIGNGKNRSAHR